MLQKVIEHISQNKEIKIELGSGKREKRDGWLTLDLNDNCDIKWDLQNGLPFPDSSIDIIYSSHLLEHFIYKEILSLLKECYRVLKVGGIISISVPNAKLFIDAYSKGDLTFWESLPLHFLPAYNNTSSPTPHHLSMWLII